MTDVDDDPSDECWPSDWECACSGMVTLAEEPASGAAILEFTATFADGGTVSGGDGSSTSQVLNNDQDNDGDQTATVNDSTACAFNNSTGDGGQ